MLTGDANGTDPRGEAVRTEEPHREFCFQNIWGSSSSFSVSSMVTTWRRAPTQSPQHEFSAAGIMGLLSPLCASQKAKERYRRANTERTFVGQNEGSTWEGGDGAQT